MKKIVLILTFLFSASFIFSKPADRVQELILENGMSVFLLPDSSNALVHIDFAVKSGFSSQTQNTNGYFKLYSKLIQNYSSKMDFYSVQCNADSTQFSLYIPANLIYDTFEELSNAAFSNSFSDDLISEQLTKLKNEVTAAAQDSGTLLNAGIDSRVFSDSPWKHDSGIYPALFKKTTPAQARTIINQISENWYTPQNSGLFVTGNFNTQQILEIINSTFGRYYSSKGIPSEKPSVSVNSQRKYVIHDSDFSKDITQLVVQYTMLDIDQCNIAATMMNNSNSSFKQKLISIEELNIPGDEYINIASANKKNNSRLIIQTLFQNPENKKIKTNSWQQAELFLSSVKQNLSSIDSQEFSYAKSLISYNQKQLFSDSINFMENLCSFWAIENYRSFSEESVNTTFDSTTTNLLYSQFEKAKNVDKNELQQAFSAEEPFVFVIINTSDWKANKKAYIQAGFEEINSKNASWYAQEYYKQLKSEENQQASTDTTTTDNDYYTANISQIEHFTLQNGIEAVRKYNPNTSNITLMLSIDGGKYKSRKNHGFEEVMINLLTQNIRKEIYRQQLQGIILGTPEVSFDSQLFTSSVLIECEKEDFDACCKAIANALIYDEITPVQADRAVSSRQYKKRLENGTAVYQLMDSAYRLLYKNTEVPLIFDSEKEILQKTSYTEIQVHYPELLDASRYKIILCGNYSDNNEELLNNTIGLLANNKLGNAKEQIPQPVFPTKKTLKTKIRHTFLTDIPAEKAGPMPAVLVPTTEFLDPMIFIVKLPEEDSKNGNLGYEQKVLFTALLYYFQDCIQKELLKNPKTKGCTVSVQIPHSQIPFLSIIVQNVKNKKEVNSVYKRAFIAMQEKLNTATGVSEKLTDELNKIKKMWILNELGMTGNSSGTAKLIQNGLEQGYAQEYYLEAYKIINDSDILDYTQLIQYFETPSLTVTSD